jgi:hypothetical protein
MQPLLVPLGAQTSLAGSSPVTLRIAPSCGCTQESFMGQKRDLRCEHGNHFEKPRPVGAKRPRRRLKQGRGFAVTKAQREKVRGLPCVGCGREASEYVAIDPAHIWSRGGRCSSPLCIVPLCRDIDGGCHRPFDKGELDLLPRLVELGYFAELAHVISEHHVSPLTLAEHVTGQRYAPVEVRERAA